MHYIPKDNEVYYKLYNVTHNHENYITVVCLQWFDESDYNENAFHEENGKVLIFETEKEAVIYLNDNFEINDIDPKYKRIKKIAKI